jgi:hypothetical protein
MNMAEPTTLPLAERLHAIEVLWDSLCHDAGYDPSPAWRADILAARLPELQKSQCTDWADAKNQILVSALQLKNRT